MHQLPRLPDAVRVLKAEDSERLDSLYTNLPKTLDRCVTCGGKKTFRWYDDYGSSDAKIVDYECPCSDQFILFKFFLNAGLGKQLQRLMLGDCTEATDQAALLAIVNYLERSDYYISRGTGLLFHGNHGSGKTLLSTILFKQLIAEGVDGHFTLFTDLLNNLSAGWRDDKDRLWFEKKVRNTTLLVIDDLGRENQGGNRMATASVDAVLRSRVQNSLPTIITTNRTIDDLGRTYSSGVMSMLSETSLTYEFNGSDYRGNQQKKTEEETRLFLSRPIAVS